MPLTRKHFGVLEARCGIFVGMPFIYTRGVAEER